jgi:hypothetical protein
MKVFLQNALTREYLKSLDAWTPLLGGAQQFEDSAEAIRFCLDHELRNMRVVLHFSEFDYDVHLPVNVPLTLQRADAAISR